MTNLTTLANGGTFSSTLATSTEEDDIGVGLLAGFAYQFDIFGQGSLTAPGFNLDNSGGGFLAGSVSVASGHYRITYTPTTTQAASLAISGGPGSYTVTSAPADDYTSNRSTTGKLAIGGITTGTLQTVADIDDFSVTLMAGVTYHFDVQGQGVLTVPTFALLNNNLFNVANSTSVGPAHYRITYKPTTSGVYFLSVGGNTTGSYSIASAPPAPADFNANGHSDLLLENNDGSIVILSQSNLAITAGISVGNPGPTWHVMGSADLSGDGHPDLLLQNNDGAIVDYLMNGTAVASGNNLGNAGASWHVRGAADFNGDGNADILLQNDNGAMVIWTTNGASVTGTASLGNPGPGWTIEGVADFNADGQPDILLQNTNGGIVDYLMSGTSIASGNYLGNPGTGWSIAGTGDYNGDGYADILLHNDSGSDVVWNTNGTTVIATAVIGNPGASYTGAVAGVDLDDDGEPDLVVQKTDGTLIGYTLNSGAVVTGSAFLGAPGAGWHAIGSNPMEFIDGTHGQASLLATPGPDQFDFTSTLGGLQQITGFDPAQDSLALSAAVFTNYTVVQAREYSYQGGTLIELAPSGNSSAVLIQGITPSQLTTANFVLR